MRVSGSHNSVPPRLQKLPPKSTRRVPVESRSRFPAPAPDLPPPQPPPSRPDLDTKIRELLHSSVRAEDSLTKEHAFNSLLIDRITNPTRAAQYRENHRLRAEKLKLLDEIRAHSHDITFSHRFGSNPLPQVDCPDLQTIHVRLQQQRISLIHQFHALKIERHDRIFEEITSLAQNYLSEEEETVDLSEDFFLSELRGEPLRLEHEIHENRSREIQLRYENEAMRLRRTCQSELKRQDSSQHSIRALFGAAQEEWNTAFIRGRNVPDLSKLADLEQQFEAVAQKVDQLVSSEAEAETELVDAESEEIQRFTEELEKWISDEKLNWLVLQARNEAIQQQIAILKQNGNQADLQDALQRETAEGAALTGMLEDATAKFRQLDVMMGGEDDDEVAPQSRFESIQERIDVVLEEDQSQTSLNAAERELKEQLNRLRKNRR